MRHHPTGRGQAGATARAPRSAALPRQGKGQSALVPALLLAAGAVLAAMGTARADDGQWRLSKIIDAQARDSQGDLLGYVEDVVFGPTGRIQSAVVELTDGAVPSGAFVEVPWTSVSADPNGFVLRLKDDAQSLRRLPRGDGATAFVDPGERLGSPLTWETVSLDGGARWGTARDMVIDGDGSVRAYIVRPGGPMWAGPLAGDRAPTLVSELPFSNRTRIEGDSGAYAIGPDTQLGARPDRPLLDEGG